MYFSHHLFVSCDKKKIKFKRRFLLLREIKKGNLWCCAHFFFCLFAFEMRHHNKSFCVFARKMWKTLNCRKCKIINDGILLSAECVRSAVERWWNLTQRINLSSACRWHLFSIQPLWSSKHVFFSFLIYFREFCEVWRHFIELMNLWRNQKGNQNLSCFCCYKDAICCEEIPIEMKTCRILQLRATCFSVWNFQSGLLIDVEW